MNYKKILQELKEFAEKEYSKFTDEFPVIGHDSPGIISCFLTQKIRSVTCDIKFNYPRIRIFMWHGDEGSGQSIVFDQVIFDRCTTCSDEELIQKVMKWKTVPFTVKTKTIKFSS